MMHNLGMRTTLDLNDALLIEAKRLAAERRMSLTAVIEDGLRAVIGRRVSESGASRYDWPVNHEARPVAGVDLTRTSALLDLTEEAP